MSSNSNRLPGGLMLLVGFVVFVVASVWQPDYRGTLSGIAAGLMGVGIVLYQIGMLEDLKCGIKDIREHLLMMSGKIEEVQKQIADLKKQQPGQDREHA
jgi:UDP-N-acetylglucosamine enolpyruvyl transferase